MPIHEGIRSINGAGRYAMETDTIMVLNLPSLYMSTRKNTAVFANRLLRWYSTHGRKDLPWQNNIDPYRVWVSEVMLQQTQVATVIPYFQQFMEQFPTVNSLAQADIDQVLHRWSGLGYYSRARNLHKTASIVEAEYNGEFPSDLDALQALPGIGRSTAGAIRATAFEIPTPILDGNVKRVLARQFGIAGWPGKSAVAKELWAVSEQCTPAREARAYTQAIMDFGATLCTRTKPACDICPVATSCVALKEGSIAELPGKKPKKVLPVRETTMFILVDQSKVLLEKRPPSGIWGGLWSFPEDRQRLECFKPTELQKLEVVKHTFSHFHLLIEPVMLRASNTAAVFDSERLDWFSIKSVQPVGLAAPIERLLQKVRELI